MCQELLTAGADSEATDVEGLTRTYEQLFFILFITAGTLAKMICSHPSAINLPQPTLNDVFAYLSRVSMPMLAERDIVTPNSSVCPFVCPSHSGTVSKRMHISANSSFHHLVGELLQFFSSATAVTKFQRKLSYWGVRYKGWGIAIFDKSQFISETVRDRPI